MHVEAMATEITDERSRAEIVRVVRAALLPFEHCLERVRVELRSEGAQYRCKLHAWSARGPTVIVETSAGSERSAVQTATDHLKLALGSRASRSDPASQQLPRSDERRISPTGGALAAMSAGSVAQHPYADRAELVARGTADRRVLLALQALDPSGAGLHWAETLGLALNAGVDVCWVLPEALSPIVALPRRSSPQFPRRQRAAARRRCRWSGGMTLEPTSTDRVVNGTGRDLADAAAHARRRSVECIILSAGDRDGGERATGLARAAGCPVLVARSPAMRSALLVATESAADNLPVLRRAAQLMNALHTTLLAFHDVHPWQPGSPLLPQLEPLVEPWKRLQYEHRLATGQGMPDLEVTLGYCSDRANAILHQAKRVDAELILVGLGGADASDEIPCAVLERAACSVLIVPPARHGRPGGRSMIFSAPGTFDGRRSRAFVGGGRRLASLRALRFARKRRRSGS